VRVSFLPDVSVRGQIELADSKRLPSVEMLTAREAKVSLDLVDLLRGRITIDALRLLKPHVTLRDGLAPATTTATPQSLFITLLGSAPVRALHVRKGRIMLPGEGGGTIKEVYAHFDAGKETGAISGFGSFTYKDATVRYSLESGSVTTTDGGESFPIALTLTSKPFRARLNGTASNANEFTIDGDMVAEIDDGRRFFKWIGVRMADGNSLKGFSAAGAFHLAGSTLTFDDGTFTLDGNKAVGLLALTAAKPRPRVEGTLAFDRLTLDPYLSGSDSSKDASDANATFPFNRPILQFIDADLRVSAAAIDAGALKLGRGGFTITAKDGSVAGEVGELELCGGSADGRINVDVAQATKKISLVANLSDVALETCLEPLALAAPVRGTASVKTELASEGTDPTQLTGNLAGTLNVEAKEGAVPVDFARLANGPTPISAEGWSREVVTSFDQLDADCRFGGGHVLCQSLSIDTPRGRVSGAGDVDLTKQSLDFDLTVTDRVVPPRPSQLTQGDAAKVSIRGPLGQPTIRRTDRPTLGEGSAASPGPGVSPH
jgi:AsmA protein